jgi:transposase-like protein
MGNIVHRLSAKEFIMTTLNKMTKAELIALAQQQGASIADLRNKLSIAQAQRNTGRGGVTRSDWPTAAGATGTTGAARPAHKLPEHFVAAREAAMRLGRSVRVGA